MVGPECSIILLQCCIKPYSEHLSVADSVQIQSWRHTG